MIIPPAFSNLCSAGPLPCPLVEIPLIGDECRSRCSHFSDL